MNRTLRLALAALALTLAAGLLFAGFGRGWLVSLLQAATIDPEAGGVERWRVQTIYDQLSLLLFYRTVFLGWSLLAFVWAFSRLRRMGRWGERAAKSSFSLFSFLFFYLSLELLAAPFLITRLDLYNYFFVLDVDHRLPASHEGIGTNRDSLRSSREREDFRPEDFNILFLGDSFTFGLGVSPQESFPSQVEERLAETFPAQAIRTVNFGWTSSSPTLGLRLVEKLGDAYEPDFVVYCLDMTDFHDDIKYQNMLDRRGIYWLYDKIPITLKLLEDLAKPLFDALYRRSNDNLPEQRFFMSEAPLKETEPYLQATRRSLRRLEAWARRRGLGFAVFVLPRAYQYNADESPENREKEFYSVLGPYSLEPFRYLESIALEETYSIYSLLDAFRSTQVFPTCFRDDPHWNADGNEVAAQAIASFLATELELEVTAEPGQSSKSSAPRPQAKTPAPPGPAATPPARD